MGQALVVCLETALVCNIWHQSTNQWTSLPPMTTRHQEGTLSLLEGQPIAIGGRHSSTVDHGVVEILNMQSNQWEQGPTLNPARRSHSTVVVNQSTVVVVGGYSEQSATLNSVMILHSEDMNWRLLPNYPQPVYAAVCGLVEVNVIVCFGGSTQTSDSYALNLSQLHAGWKRAPQYDFHTSLVYGVILRLRQNLFCTNQWTSLPPMTTRHQEGTLSLLEGQPIAIGGRHSSTVDHGVVEILNMQSNQWEQGTR
ncbi:hypothetical protein TCAL_13977 [Tigriopus californicus]|uniref:Uncharacterized protein n=1 Tax=Tigriopus californicus TaxID=6832 RepID=A0A553PRC6_TIGCA|nr:hypothetical protein TCAL_13977 [Tigriopus californicus]